MGSFIFKTISIQFNFTAAEMGKTQSVQIFSKQSAFNSFFTAAEMGKTQSVQIRQDAIGALIGPGGDNIRDFRERSGCRIKVCLVFVFILSEIYYVSNHYM